MQDCWFLHLLMKRHLESVGWWAKCLLFTLYCVFLQGDGREEVVACAWDGQTYIIDHNRSVVRFQFDENVNAFCAGEDPSLSLTSQGSVLMSAENQISSHDDGMRSGFHAFPWNQRVSGGCALNRRVTPVGGAVCPLFAQTSGWDSNTGFMLQQIWCAQ